MESRGHECTLLLYERDSDEAARHELLIRANWPQISARVASATTSHQRFDAIVASSWVSAHVVSRRFADVINKFYFIQDYEPYFYPRGYLYTLAEMTYEFGFMNIALGEMVANEIRTRNSIDPELTVPFGCDNDVYQIKARATGTLKRNGVVYYAKQSVDRRGYLLAKAALERFHELCPDQEIHIVGDKIRGWKIPVINHGSMRPSDLNDLYNCTIAGLAMSFTNVSLVPGELLAAGNVPVLNSDPDVQRDLASSEVIWAAPNPEALARGLVKAVSRPELEEHARRAGAGAPVGWGAAQQMVTEFIESQTGAPSENTSSGNLPIVAQTQESPLRHVE
ncbi:glycosyltransferase family 4 protein [Arthrobacter sp. MYb227]|uniref:glycosyltransferase family 4 protein n=1 Tax=Arthrobacter sp. MYb227 TaxID=1848601 RepID=UPI0011B05CD4|nr:glycosyltransferase family 4 protein [Arthrobacter sp. MYb227]